MRDNTEELGFKYTFFRTCLYVSMSAMFLQLIVSLVLLNQIFQIVLSAFLLLVSTVSLILWNKPSRYLAIVVSNALSWMIAFIFYWLGTQGVHSAPAYVFFVLVTVFIIALPKPFGFYYTVLMCIACITLSSIAPTGLGDLNTFSRPDLYYVLATQFLICLFVIVISLYYLKTNFDNERTNIEKSNKTLINLTAELVSKKKELLEKRRKIENLKMNLENLVHDRTMQLEKKNEQLSHYAYDNAHTLRGALCNILAVISLIKKEQNDDHVKQVVDQLNSKAIDLDGLIYQVNNLLK